LGFLHGFTFSEPDIQGRHAGTVEETPTRSSARVRKTFLIFGKACRIASHFRAAPPSVVVVVVEKNGAASRRLK